MFLACSMGFGVDAFDSSMLWIKSETEGVLKPDIYQETWQKPVAYSLLT